MTTFIHNGTLIDGTGAQPVANGGLLVDDGKINQVGVIQAPAGTERIDAQGGYILPGFIDTHVHIMTEIAPLQQRASTPFSMMFYQALRNMRRTLDVGITSVRDAGGADLGVKKSVETGLIQGPRMQISITILGITGGHTDGWNPSGLNTSLFPVYPGNPSGICDGVPEVRKKVREVLRAGAEVIKICSTGGVMSPTDHPNFTQFSEEELAVIVQEGHYRNGVKVMAHAQGREGILNAVKAGIHSIEHGIYLDDEIIDLMLEKGTFLVPTLLAPLAVLEIGEATGTMPAYAIEKSKEVIEAHTESIAQAYRAGVKIAMGTDAGVMPHGTNLRELNLMHQIGMTPMETIVATTKTAAECLGWDDRIGTLEKGKFADVIITKTNPLEDLKSLEDPKNILFVMQGGKVVKDIRA
ncbi:amidohydrolase family protein [Phototrophicus methaneseepsis]|uniref:Amidohydrolase family protein n=1 Tax=Phototrophicus methaneseepsis TaxID=2710758 RepID=A0A7S8EDC0_9CHLR|nr:amidohydrolase family protein [Phototrophicus methaneseepsis]QPC84653.1 amidohydrolase family protein [Phototrophicus methaneseepsis]